MPDPPNAPPAAGAPRLGLLGWLAHAPEPVRAALHACRTHFAALIGFSFLYNLLFLAPALFMMQVYDRVLATRGLETLAFLCLVLAAALITLGVMDWTRTRLLTRIGLHLEHAFAPSLVRSLLSAGAQGAADPRRTQALREFDILRAGVAGPGPLALIDLPWAVIFILVLTIVHWSFGIIAVIAGGLLIALSMWNERSAKPALAKAAESALRAHAMIETSAANADAVRGLGLRDALTAKHLQERAIANGLQAQTGFDAAAFQSGIKMLRLVSQNALLAWGAFLAVEGQITAGAMFAASILGARALQPIEQLTGALRSLIQARNAYDSLAPMLRAPPAEPPTRLPTPKARLHVDGVFVARPGGGEPILKGVSFGVGPGEVIGVIGPSGSGKSTLARALIGAVPAVHGHVRVDGAPLAQWDMDVLGQALGYLPQAVQLLPGTVKENISRFGARRGIDNDLLTQQVVEAARLAGAHNMILSLSRGYDTELGVNGAGVSGGQAQRIALARALYGAPPILILDEPNAFLDQDGETALLTAIRAVRERDGCVVMIAHRAGVLAACDRLVVLRDGRMEMQGARDQIAARLNERSPASGPAPGPAPITVVGGRP